MPRAASPTRPPGARAAVPCAVHPTAVAAAVAAATAVAGVAAATRVPVALATDGEDVTVVEQPVEDRGGNDRIAEDLAPFAKPV